jgi:hypothetical protein
MKGERKLRLVKGGSEPSLPDDEPPFTPEEIAAAEALRDEGDPLFAALQAAHQPAALPEDDLDAILARAMGDDDATTSTERAAADRLRAELSGEAPASDASAVLVALKAAHSPKDLPAARHHALIEAAFARVPFLRRGPAVRRLAPVTMAALSGIAAIAAGVALFLGKPPVPPTGATAALVRTRSAEDLFEPTTPFPRHGGESARIDRIASARAADLRQNRYAAWGVK